MVAKSKTRTLGIGLVVILMCGVAVWTWGPARWWPFGVGPSGGEVPDEHEHAESFQEFKQLQLSSPARKNLGLVSKPVVLQDYWRKIQVPGVIVDRPGVSDRGVTSPAVGVVSQVLAFEGDMVRPGDKLFTLRLFSEYLQNTQSELFKAVRETQLVKEERSRLEGLARSGTIPEARIIELDQRIRRQDALIQAYRQDLLTRGLAPPQIEQIAEGKFVSSIDVVAPPPAAMVPGGDSASQPPAEDFVYEVQELKVDLGQQVQAGESLSILSDHRLLFLEGHAFKKEAPHLERAAQHGWSVQVEFAEDAQENWPHLQQTFTIRHLANTIDRTSRTFDFYVPLVNQSRAYEKEGKAFQVWRFRPGQRVRLHIPVEQLEKVVVVPAAAVVREGPEAYVFSQNGDLFRRIPVNVLHEDRLHAVLSPGRNVPPGIYLAQNSAASLNRVLKAQSSSGQADVHVHADGTVHAAH